MLRSVSLRSFVCLSWSTFLAGYRPSRGEARFNPLGKRARPRVRENEREREREREREGGEELNDKEG